MSSITATQLRPAEPAVASSTPLPAPPPPPTPPRTWRRRLANFWLNALFWNAAHCRPVARFFRAPTIGFCRRFSTHVREALHANGPVILGPSASPARLAAYERGVIGHFYDFVCDVG